MQRLIIPTLVVLTGLGVAAANAWAFADRGSWFYMLLAGLFPPLYGLVQWWVFRRRGGEAQKVADSMIWAVLLAAIALMVVSSQ